MQVNTQNIQRPKLFSGFFTKELDFKNDFVSYIDAPSDNSNVVHNKLATSTTHNNIKKSLKSKKFNAVAQRRVFSNSEYISIDWIVFNRREIKLNAVT